MEDYMLRNDHRIMIQQNVEGSDHWTIIRLNDLNEYWDGATKYVTGTWKHTRESYNDSLIEFTSDNPRHLTFTWIGGPQGGILNIGSTMDRASHRADETEV